MFASFVRTFSGRRRLSVTSDLITGRDQAAEVRAFTTQPVLLAEHRRIADELTADAVRLERDQTVVQLVGRTLSGIGTALAYLALALLLYGGVLPLALAGTAAVAMRTAAQSVSRRGLAGQPALRGELLHRHLPQLPGRGRRRRGGPRPPPSWAASRG